MIIDDTEDDCGVHILRSINKFEMVKSPPNEHTPILEKGTTNDTKLDILNHDGNVDKFYPHNPFGEKHDKQFWDDLRDRNKNNPDKPWITSLNEMRLEKIQEMCDKNGAQEMMLHFMELYDRFLEIAESRNEIGMMPAFVGQLATFINLLIDQDFEGKKKPKLSRTIDITEEIDMTVLHMAAKRNLTPIIRIILKYYPDMVYDECLCGGQKAQKALELALLESHDDASAHLIQTMTPQSVCELFNYDQLSGDNNISFNSLVVNPAMKKTVQGILECMIDPEFPYTPTDPKSKRSEISGGAWSKLPNAKPQRYHINYKMLDGDQYGRSENEHNFDFKAHSGLYDVAHSPFSNEIIEHPVVRLLTQRKWKLYGKRYIGIYIAFYLLFLVSMTCAFFLKLENGDRSKYKTGSDHARAVFEVLTLVMGFMYFIVEIVDAAKEKRNYLTFTNLVDFFGNALVISLVPIKFLTADLHKDHSSELECYVSAVTYFINILRLFKFFPVIDNIGVHAKLIAQLLIKDIPRFLVVYGLVAAAFFGAVLLALSAQKDGYKNAEITPWSALLAEVRALTEGNGFDDSYIGKFKPAIIVLLMFNMLCCILIMMNILIAHLSNVYTAASDRAKIQCDIDRAVLITKLERTIFRCMSPRLKYYKAGEYCNDHQKVAEMVKEWRQAHPIHDDSSSEHILDQINDVNLAVSNTLDRMKFQLMTSLVG